MSQPNQGSPPDSGTEIAAAENMLRLGDLMHAAEHAAQAIVADPGAPAAYELVERVEAAGGGSDRLFSVDTDKIFIGDVAARAHLLARGGDHADAVRLILMATLHEPEGRWTRAPWWRDIAKTTDPLGVAAVLAELAEALAVRVTGTTRVNLIEVASGLADRNDTDVDVAVALALAALHWNAAALGEGWVRRSLTHDPRNLRGRAAAEALAYVDTDDVAHLVQVADMGRETGQWEVVRPVLDAVCHTRSWLNRVPMPEEAIASVMRDMTAQAKGKNATISQLAATAVESPTATAAFLALQPGVPMDVNTDVRPDPRTPFAPGAHAVWRFHGGVIPTPAAPEPSQEASNLLRTIANEPWPDPVAAYERTAPFAAYPLDQLLGLLCHLPPQPDNDRWAQVGAPQPLYWPRLASAWGCVGLLHHRPEEPWATSARRAVLHDLAFGIEDWTTDGALFALVVAAWRDPDARADVHDTVAARFELVRKTVKTRPVSIAASIANLMLIAPGVTARERKAVTKFLRKLAK